MKARFPLAGVVVVSAALLSPTDRVRAQGVNPQGTEFPITVRAPGDQVNPFIALGKSGGFIVWQDAAIDGEGLGIAALRLNATLSSQPDGGFRVNEATSGDQENGRAVVFPDGGAFFAWQGGRAGFQTIKGRVILPSGTFAGGEFAISSGAGEQQTDPVLALTTDGQVIVVWSSYRQEGQYYNVYGRRFTATGEPLGPEFRVNSELGLNRRSPAVVPLASGGFMAAWVGETMRGQRDNLDSQGRPVAGAGAPVFDVAIYARVFDSSGNALGPESRAEASGGISAHPALAPLPNGQVALAWTRRDPLSRSNSLDVFSRTLSPQAAAASDARMVNSHTYGDQYRPRFAATSGGNLLVWSSMGQDGSWEGVYGRWMGPDGALSGDEFKINTTTAGGQILPAAASDNAGQILVAWSSNVPRFGMELFGQHLQTLREVSPLSAPIVVPLSSSSVMVSWPPISGLDIASYRVYADSGAQLAEVSEAFWKFEGLAPATSVAVQVSYVLPSTEVSPKSAPGTGKTWGADLNFDGLPDDWQEKWWPGASRYPAGSADSDGDGVSNLDEWLAGTDPTDPTSCLKLRWQNSALGFRIEWPTQPGYVYQLESSENGQSWNPVRGPRFAADSTDSVVLPQSGEMALYRVVRVR